MRWVGVVVLLGVGCARTGAELAAPARPVATAAGTITPVDPAPDGTPVAASALEARLAVRHPEDLPDRATIEAFGGEAALLAAASDAGLLVVRARALELLAFFPTATSRDALGRVLRDAAAHEKLRASAVVGLASFPPEDAEARAHLLHAVGDASARVALDAVEVLSPLAGEALRLRAADPGVLPEVRARVLGP